MSLWKHSGAGLHRYLFIFAAGILAAAMQGCGGGTSTPPPPTLTISPSSASVLLGNTQQFTCNTSCGSWAVNGTSGGSASFGTISSSGLYTAPADLPGTTTVTVSATSQGNSGQTANASAVIQSDISVSIATSPSGVVSAPENGTVQFSATISSSGKPDRSVTWAVNGLVGGSAATGTISSGGLYTAPSSLPNPPVAAVSATTVADISKKASASLTIAGTIATVSQQIAAAAGGTVTLPDGSNVIIPPSALASDQTVTLSEVTILPKQPPNSAIVTVGTGLILSLSAPNPASAARNSVKYWTRSRRGNSLASSTTDLQFTIMEGSTNGLQGAAPIVDATDTSGNDNFIGPSGVFSLPTNLSSISVTTPALGSVTSLAVSLANWVGLTPSYGPKALTDTGWENYAPGACPSHALILVHGMGSAVEKAYPSSSSCAGDIQSKGNYDQVLGFDYDWTQDINDSGSKFAMFLNSFSTSCPNTDFDIEAHSEGVPVTLSAAGLATSAQAHIKTVVSLGGPILGTPVANTAQSIDTGLLNEQDGTPLGQGNLGSALFGAFAGGLLSNSSELATIRQNFATAPGLKNTNVLEVGGNKPSGFLFSVADATLFPPNTPNDGIIPLNSALPTGSGLQNETQLPPFPDNHTALECDPNVQNSVGAQLALQISPTSLTFTLPSDGTNPPSQTIQLNNQKAIDWVAGIADPSFLGLTISPASGVTPSSITVSVETAALVTIPANTAINLTATYSAGSSVPTSIPVTITAASSTFSGSFTGTITDDMYGPCPGATAAMQGGVSITLTPAGSGLIEISGNVTLTQLPGLCNDYSGTYPVTGGIDSSGNVAFVYQQGPNPPAVTLGFLGTLSGGVMSGNVVLEGGIDSKGNYADSLASPLTLNKNATAENRHSGSKE